VRVRSCPLSPGPTCQYVPWMPWSRNLATHQFCSPRLINPLNLGIQQNVFKNAVPVYRKTPVVNYRVQPINIVRVTLDVYCKNHVKHVHALCGQNAEFMSIRTDWVYRYH
jgi:hypothetical protein